jgi:hypothetical protein
VKLRSLFFYGRQMRELPSPTFYGGNFFAADLTIFAVCVKEMVNENRFAGQAPQSRARMEAWIWKNGQL